MYEIIFYKDKSGKNEILEYMLKLQNNKDKDSRIKFNKIRAYIEVLKINGTAVGESEMKRLERRYLGTQATKIQNIICLLER